MNANIRLAFGVEQAVIVDDNVVTDLDLVRMAKNHVLAEDNIVAALAKEPGIANLSQGQPKPAGDGLRDKRHQFVLDQRPKARPSHHQGAILAHRTATREELILR